MKDITVKEFQEVKDKFVYDALLCSLKPNNLFCDKILDVNTITYLEVKNIFKIIKNGKSFDDIFNMFAIAFKIEKHEFDNAPITIYYQAKNYLIKFCKDTLAREQKLMKSISNPLWESAGGANLNPFSDLIGLVQIGEIYGIYPYDLQHKPYNEILTLLVLHKRKTEIENKYSELKNKK